MDDPASTPDLRRRYEDALVRAMRHAERLLPRDQAFEIAHDSALEMLRRPPSQVTGTLIYLAVISRVRKLHRAVRRRAAIEGAYLEMRSGGVPAWGQPGADLEASELRARFEDVVAQMPPGMRDAFLLVREHDLSYREAATRLGVSVGTVHTQLSRANVLLRACVREYHRQAESDSRSGRGAQP